MTIRVAGQLEETLVAPFQLCHGDLIRIHKPNSLYHGQIALVRGTFIVFLENPEIWTNTIDFLAYRYQAGSLLVMEV